MAKPRIEKSKRALILAALSEGAAINSICRMFRVAKPSVLRFLRECGNACEDWHNTHFRNLTVARIECDEQWNWVHTHKERLSAAEKTQYMQKGDAWFWIGMDADSKAILSWMTGKRTATHAYQFANDLASRVLGRVAGIKKAKGKRLTYKAIKGSVASNKAA